MKNIDGWIGMLLGVTKVNTFKDLLRSVSNMKNKIEECEQDSSKVITL
jgi:hypothetical protein